MLLINRRRFEIHKGEAVRPSQTPAFDAREIDIEPDIWLDSVWHGPPTIGTLHFSLYNNGQAPVEAFTLCLTGTLWLSAHSEIQGGKLTETLSNYIRIEPERRELEVGGVWTFSLCGLNGWPRRAGDGPQSAYLAFDDGRFTSVAVRPLGRVQCAEEIVEARPDEEASSAVSAALQMTLGVIPFPNVASVSIAPLPPTGAVLSPAQDQSVAQAELFRSVDSLAHRVVPGIHEIFAEVGGAGLRRLSVRLVQDARLGPEGYKVVFDGPEIYVDAETDTGLFYGLITLAQMVVAARTSQGKFGFPVRGTLTDIPRFAWRGVMLDVARTYYPIAEIRAIVDLLAWHKLNVFHLHLNDDEGWRIGVEGYPGIATHCGARGHGLLIPPLLGSSFEPYGAIYLQADIADLERHASALYVEVIPEIDVPGHADALLRVTPDLREIGDTGGYVSIQGFKNNALNPCLPQTYNFLDAALKSVTASFQGSFVHIGGDEVGPETWSRSPSAIDAARVRGLAATGELQGDIFRFVERWLEAAGRKIVAWEDAFDHSPFSAASAIAVAWQHPERAHERARLGYDVVLAPGNAYYLDMATSCAWESSGGHWAGVVPLKQTYDFEAELGWPQDLLPKLRGVHACIWGEYMHDRRTFDALVFPRFFAFAERAWIDRTAKDFAGFLVRAQASTARVDRLGNSQ